MRKVVPGPEGSKLLYELGTNAVDEITPKVIEDFLTEVSCLCLVWFWVGVI